MEAIKQQKVVCLKDYSSPHSNTVTDRMVEPYQLLNENLDIRCYELKTHMCKTFKLARIGEVVVYDTPWIYTDLHTDVFIDMFMFSGTERDRKSTRLNSSHANISYAVFCLKKKNIIK